MVKFCQSYSPSFLAAMSCISSIEMVPYISIVVLYDSCPKKFWIHSAEKPFDFKKMKYLEAKPSSNTFIKNIFPTETSVSARRDHDGTGKPKLFKSNPKPKAL